MREAEAMDGINHGSHLMQVLRAPNHLIMSMLRSGLTVRHYPPIILVLLPLGSCASGYGYHVTIDVCFFLVLPMSSASS